MMKQILAVFIIFSLGNCQRQLYFPGDAQLVHYMTASENNVPTFNRIPSVPQSNLETKDSIVTRGILKLTLAVDSALQTLRGPNTDVTVYSPVGIASALALVLLGANGKTFEEISTIMGLASGLDIENSSQSVHELIGKLMNQIQSNENLDSGVTVNLATGVFVQEGFPIRPIYKQISQNIYRSEITNVNFQYPGAEEIINNWVRQKTNSKITSILPQTPSKSTKVIICSALYFIGQWEKPFFEGLTKRRPFYPNGRKSKNSVMADMMSNGGSFPYYKDSYLDCEIMGFPYKGNKTTMYIVMPHHSDKERLRSLESRLTPSELERLVSSTRYQKSVVLFPKMKLESTVDLTQALQIIGARSLFNKNEANLALLSPGPGHPTYNNNPQEFTSNNRQQSGNFQSSNFKDVLIFSRFADNNCNSTDCHNQEASNRENHEGHRRNKRQAYGETIDSVRRLINVNGPGSNTENPGLYADQVLHKVYMDITETGTEAAATTSVSISRGGDLVTFRVDHPFLFFIMDEQTKLVLFWGSVTTPTPSFS